MHAIRYKFQECKKEDEDVLDNIINDAAEPRFPLYVVEDGPKSPI